MRAKMGYALSGKSLRLNPNTTEEALCSPCKVSLLTDRYQSNIIFNVCIRSAGMNFHENPSSATRDTAEEAHWSL
jgi:hypothetical protein